MLKLIFGKRIDALFVAFVFAASLLFPPGLAFGADKPQSESFDAGVFGMSGQEATRAGVQLDNSGYKVADKAVTAGNYKVNTIYEHTSTASVTTNLNELNKKTADCEKRSSWNWAGMTQAFLGVAGIAGLGASLYFSYDLARRNQNILSDTLSTLLAKRHGMVNNLAGLFSAVGTISPLATMGFNSAIGLAAGGLFGAYGAGANFNASFSAGANTGMNNGFNNGFNNGTYINGNLNGGIAANANMGINNNQIAYNGPGITQSTPIVIYNRPYTNGYNNGGYINGNINLGGNVGNPMIYGNNYGYSNGGCQCYLVCSGSGNNMVPGSVYQNGTMQGTPWSNGPVMGKRNP